MKRSKKQAYARLVFGETPWEKLPNRYAWVNRLTGHVVSEQERREAMNHREGWRTGFREVLGR